MIWKVTYDSTIGYKRRHREEIFESSAKALDRRNRLTVLPDVQNLSVSGPFEQPTETA